MNVGLDIDDTISRHPEFFALLSRALTEAGHRVVIITLREDRKAAASDLHNWGITYHDLVTATCPALVEEGVFQWKARMCSEHAIQIFFEDAPETVRCIDHERTLCFMPIHPEFHDLDGMAGAL